MLVSTNSFQTIWCPEPDLMSLIFHSTTDFFSFKYRLSKTCTVASSLIFSNNAPFSSNHRTNNKSIVPRYTLKLKNTRERSHRVEQTFSNVAVIFFHLDWSTERWFIIWYWRLGGNPRSSIYAKLSSVEQARAERELNNIVDCWFDDDVKIIQCV